MESGRAINRVAGEGGDGKVAGVVRAGSCGFSYSGKMFDGRLTAGGNKGEKRSDEEEDE